MRKLLLLLSLFGSLSATAQQAAEAAILTCTANASPMTVVRATQSAGAPAIATGTNCAQALADLTAGGFSLQSAEVARAGAHVLYTLIKPAVAPQCSNGIDDDNDGLTDLADPQCTSGMDNAEGN